MPDPTRLADSLTIGPIRLRNRIVSAPHGTRMSEGGHVSERLIAYQRKRARAGVGLVITEVAQIDPRQIYSGAALRIDDDRFMPGFTRLAEAVKGEGAAIFGQIFHPGGNMSGSHDGRRLVLESPSENLSGRYHAMSREMTEADIARVVGLYAEAAARMAEAGFDGIEIYAGHGCLPAQFLDPALNRRRDGYGGTPENERRFLREVIAAVRARIGPLVLGLRLSPPDGDPMGEPAPELAEICAALEQEAPLDYFSIAAGSMRDVGGSVLVVPPMGIPAEECLAPAAAVKRAVRTPVIAAGRIQTPAEAERALETGLCDLVALARPMICDPLWAEKALADEAGRIRGCISCNQACIGHLHIGQPISCIQHPESGREYLPDATRGSGARVLVVGGGPAGMKAAASAAALGHLVTLCEAGPALGGQVLSAQSLPGRAEFGGIVQNLAREMNEAGVEVRLRVEADLHFIRDFRADAVIIATGAGERAPDFPGCEEDAVLSVTEIIEGRARPGGHVLVADATCDWIALGVAEKLALEGRRVTLASAGYMAGESVQKYVRDAWLGRLHRLGVRLEPMLGFAAFDEGSAYFRHLASRETVEIDGVESLVPVLGRQARRCLSDELAAAGIAHHIIGDCASPRTAEEAILEGWEIAARIKKMSFNTCYN